MNSIKKIQDKNIYYTLLSRYVKLFFPSAYSKIEYRGLENIPKDAAIIYAPNHTNALMDALVVLFVDNKPKVFVARADMFRNKALAKILTFLKIMPIMRIRDGYANLKKNDEIINKAVDVLCSGTPFCILPEGTHRAMHSLLPLTKGIFRIALQAEEKLPEGKPLYIVPFGIEYGNFFRYHSSLLINIGRPINVREFKNSACGNDSTIKENTEAELINAMKNELAERMKELITYIPDDENYETLRVHCALHNSSRGSLYEKMMRNKTVLNDYFRLKEANPFAAEELLCQAKDIQKKVEKNKISLSSLTKRHLALSCFFRALVSLIYLPYGIIGGILSSPIHFISMFIYKKMDDNAFYNSLRFLATVIIWPILFIIYSIITLVVLNSYDILNCYYAIPSLIAIWFMAQSSTWWFRFTRRLISDIKKLIYI